MDRRNGNTSLPLTQRKTGLTSRWRIVGPASIELPRLEGPGVHRDVRVLTRKLGRQGWFE